MAVLLRFDQAGRDDRGTEPQTLLAGAHAHGGEKADVAHTAQSPIPDSGDVEGDLRAYAANVARDITGPAGPAILRLAIALSAAGPDGARLRDEFLDERYRQLQAMLDRSRERGERSPETMEVIDHILAPIYFRVVFGAEHLDAAYTEGLVERLLASLGGTTGSREHAADAGDRARRAGS